jgi:hypothetical protein
MSLKSDHEEYALDGMIAMTVNLERLCLDVATGLVGECRLKDVCGSDYFTLKNKG